MTQCQSSNAIGLDGVCGRGFVIGLRFVRFPLARLLSPATLPCHVFDFWLGFLLGPDSDHEATLTAAW